MPLTLPTHPMAVLPLKVWRPRWFDGVALVVGSVAPDVPYALDGFPVEPHAHGWLAPLWWAVPLALVCVPVIRRSAAGIAAHVPPLRDYGVLARVRHRPWTTAGSAVLGAYSHILWDSVTHATIDYRPIPWRGLTSQAFPGWTWFEVLSRVSNAVGLVAAVALVVVVGRSRLLVRWHGPAPDRGCRPLAFWGTLVAVTLAGAAVLPYLPSADEFTVRAVRCLLIGCAALVLASCAAGGAVGRAFGSDRRRAAETAAGR